MGFRGGASIADHTPSFLALPPPPSAVAVTSAVVTVVLWAVILESQRRSTGYVSLFLCYAHAAASLCGMSLRGVSLKTLLHSQV